ncbi:MAG: ABC transporter substrate-binding protein [Chloroflexi bacterium]|nr:ABC transporter substrate-binding protein [Chloroflexota bacterium]
MKRRWVLVTTAIALLVPLLILPLASCKSKPPANAEIRVGIMGGVTGATSSAVLPVVEELQHFMRYMNEVEGGIDSVKFSYKVADTKGTPDGAVLAYKELRDSFKPMIYIPVEDYLLVPMIDQIAQDKSVILTITAIDNKLYVPAGRAFGMGIPVADGFAGYVKWVKGNWKGQGQPKIGVLHWDRPSGLGWQMAQSWVKKQGIELVPAPFSITAMDLKPQLMALRDAKVDYIWMAGISPNVSVAIRDFRGLGLAGKMPFTFNEFTEAHTVLALAGAAAEGFYEYRAESPYSEDTEASKLYTKVWKWAANQDKWSDNRHVVTFDAVMKAAVKQAVADSGWEKLSGDTLYTALTKLNKVDTMGNMKDFGFGPDKRIGVSTIKMKQYTKTGTVPVGDWISLPRIFEGIDK